MKMLFNYYSELHRDSKGLCKSLSVDLGDCKTVKFATVRVVRMIAEACEAFRPRLYPDLTGACNVVGTVSDASGHNLAVLRMDSQNRYRWCIYKDVSQ